MAGMLRFERGLLLLVGACWAGIPLTYAGNVRPAGFNNPHPADFGNPHPADFGNVHPADFGTAHPAANVDVNHVFPDADDHAGNAAIAGANLVAGRPGGAFSLAFPNAANVTIILPANTQFAFGPGQGAPVNNAGQGGNNFNLPPGFIVATSAHPIANSSQTGAPNPLSPLAAQVITNTAVRGILSPLAAQVITNTAVRGILSPLAAQVITNTAAPGGFISPLAAQVITNTAVRGRAFFGDAQVESRRFRCRGCGSFLRFSDDFVYSCDRCGFSVSVSETGPHNGQFSFAGGGRGE